MNNIHAIFTNRKNGFKYQIRPTQSDFEALNNAKKTVRSHLKSKIKEYLEKHGIYYTVPKFRVQGSWAYGTCNAPAKQGQEMDIDYGVYLPVSAFDGFDANSQSEQAKVYFAEVETMLNELCGKNRWKLDTTKSSCIRLGIQDNAHMDIPLYAVPDDMFDAFKENHELQLSVESMAYDSILESRNKYWAMEDYGVADFTEESLQEKNIQTIHMATRDGNWKSSDCEIIRQWFADKLAEHPNNGQQLRDICRYLKAWRDWAFQENQGSPPSSILLMIIACKYYQYQQQRDDLALLGILKQLPDCLNTDVYENIQDHNNENFNRMNNNERKIARIRAEDLLKHFQNSLNSKDKYTAISSLIGQWGERIPQNTDLIQIDKDPFDGTPLIQSSITPQVPLRQG